MTDTKLKPCHRCGSKKVMCIDEQRGKKSIPPVWWHVICSACGIRTSVNWTEEQARADWNQIYPQKRSALLEAAEEVLAEDCSWCKAHGEKRCNDCTKSKLKAAVEKAKGEKQ